eukprot:gene11277-11425_t
MKVLGQLALGINSDEEQHADGNQGLALGRAGRSRQRSIFGSRSLYSGFRSRQVDDATVSLLLQQLQEEDDGSVGSQDTEDLLVAAAAAAGVVGPAGASVSGGALGDASGPADVDLERVRVRGRSTSPPRRQRGLPGGGSSSSSSVDVPGLSAAVFAAEAAGGSSDVVAATATGFGSVLASDAGLERVEEWRRWQQQQQQIIIPGGRTSAASGAASPAGSHGRGLFSGAAAAGPIHSMSRAVEPAAAASPLPDGTGAWYAVPAAAAVIGDVGATRASELLANAAPGGSGSSFAGPVGWGLPLLRVNISKPHEDSAGRAADDVSPSPSTPAPPGGFCSVCMERPVQVQQEDHTLPILQERDCQEAAPFHISMLTR